MKKKSKQRFIWDIILILLIVPYFYLVYQGISYDFGILGLYYKILAPALVFTTVVRWLINFLLRKAKR